TTTGGGMKQAIHAYERSLTTQAISQATGVPAWYLDQRIAEKEAHHAMTSSFSYNLGTTIAGGVKYAPSMLLLEALVPGLREDVNKFVEHVGEEAYKNRETIDTVVTVVATIAATVAAPVSFGGSLAIMGALAAYKTVEGAVEGGIYGALAGAATIGNAFLSTYTGGMVSYDLSYSRTEGFSASVGSGMKIVEGLGIGSTISYNEQSGFGASFGLQAGTSALSYNAGLSYSERDGISGSAGIGLGLGRNAATGSYSSTLNLGVSYNRRDGFGTSVGISRNNNVVMPGVGASISRSEYGGWGADITSNQYGQTEGAGGRPGFGGVSGGLSWSERDGFTASFNVSGTNAFSYNSQTGLSSNSDFLSQSAMNNGLSQGVAQTDEEKAHAARVEAEERARAAQNRNNQESGAAAVSAAGVLTQRRDEDGFPAHGAPGLNDPGQTLSSSGSFGPEGESSGVGRRPLSSEDKAAFWENWRGETRAQTDASLADLRRMGYDTSELEGRVQAYRNNQDSRPGSASTPQPTTHQSQGTGLYGGVVQNILNSAMSGASSLWDRITGGSSSKPVSYNDVENGKRIVSAAEDLLKQNSEKPFVYELGSTGNNGKMDCTGYIYRALNDAGMDHIPYMGGSRIQSSPLYQEIPESQRIPGDVKIVTLRNGNGEIVTGHGMIYNGGNPGKEFYEMSGGKKGGMKPSGDYMENHYRTNDDYKDGFANKGYYLETGYYRPKPKGAN
ncbi:hypothetical protein, partial [Leptospira santarosai]|uniref:hypothetical protein n=1 Tax=Leptospira santarosai TaxID=28183 RepID=UPI00051854B2